MFHGLRLTPVFVLALLLLGTPTQRAEAVTATTTLAVTATVLNTCLVSAQPLPFGNYDPNATTDLDITTTITVTCTTGTTYNVGLDKGANGASVTARAMKSGSNTLNYSMFRDSARTQNWGNTVGTDTVPRTAALVPDVLTVYGRVAKSQNVPAGLYTDTVQVTVTY
jgi:spore coat protein U-like protein